MLRRRRRTGRTRGRGRSERTELAITLDDVLRDLDPGWLTIDWTEVGR